jgi:hypothetical protein
MLSQGNRGKLFRKSMNYRPFLEADKSSPLLLKEIMNKDTFRVVTRGADGEIRIRDYDNAEALLKRHSQIGVDDCSTDLGLRGLPVFRGLIGPIPEGKNIIRYESPEVFETLTKEWSNTRPIRRRRTRMHNAHVTS